MIKGISFLFQYTWKFEKKYIVYNFLNQIISAIVPLLDIVIPKFIIDELIGDKNKSMIFLWIVALILTNFAGSMLRNFFQGQCFVLKGSVFTQFQSMLAEQLSKCDFERLEDPEFLNNKEKAQKFLYANGQGFGVVLDSAFNIIGKFFTFIGIIAIISTMNIFIVFVAIALVLWNSLYESKVRKKYVKWDFEKAPIERKTNYLCKLVEDFSFGKEVRLYGIKDWIISKVKKHLGESYDFYKKQANEMIKTQYLSGFTNFILEAVTYCFLAFQVIQSLISIGDFSMYVSAMINFSNSMRDVMESFLDIRQFNDYYKALVDYMNVPANMRKGKNLHLPNASYEIEFSNVSFRYAGQKNWALRNINIVIKNNEKLSIIGENGAGKTTFIKLLCRLYDPTEGKILLCGIDIRDIAYDEYLKIIGSVFQDYKLFSFSLKENIAFDQSSEEPDDKISEILKQSGLTDKLSKLDKGIHSYLFKNFEKDGFEPSGGEGQKIALARALYKDASIMILDEPTSALDPHAEYEIYQQFHKLVQGKTAIFISHRMSSSKFCDRIALFSNGEIAEYGTHEQLMKQKCQYWDFFRMQAQYYL